MTKRNRKAAGKKSVVHLKPREGGIEKEKLQNNLRRCSEKKGFVAFLMIKTPNQTRGDPRDQGGVLGIDYSIGKKK